MRNSQQLGRKGTRQYRGLRNSQRVGQGQTALNAQCPKLFRSEILLYSDLHFEKHKLH